MTAISGSRDSFKFAALFAVESFCRSLNATVVSVQAYDLLGSSAAVSRLSVIVSFAVLITTMLMPVFFGLLRRRWAYTAGATGLIVSALFLASFTLPGQIAGVYLRNVSASLLSVTLSLYIMDFVAKHELVRSESLRLTVSTFSWMIGPALGVYLYGRYGPAACQIIVMCAGCLLLCTFWYIKLKDPDLLPAGTLARINPLANVWHFARQPRLLLSWSIAFGRSCFWMTLFIYGPLVLIESGASKEFAGVIISLSQASLFLGILYGRVAAKRGVRTVITFCFAIAGMSAIAAGLAGEGSPMLTAAFLLLGSLACVGLDAVGGVPFLRFVKPRERQSMAPVYRSYIDLSELLPSIVFAIALLIFDTPIVFGLLGAFLFVLAGIAWQHLPKSM
jgi:MFS family permease